VIDELGRFEGVENEGSENFVLSIKKRREAAY
jgi:hypothetical protein